MATGTDPLRAAHAEAGARFEEVDGAEVPRHYGDPAGEYAAAVGPGAVFDRSYRALLPVEGRAPTQMLGGIVSGSIPPDHVEVGSHVLGGEATYSTVLTPKGKLVTDLRLLRLGSGAEGGLLMDVPPAGLEGLIEHLKRYLPPRFAKIVEPPEPLGLLTVTGEEAAELLAGAVPELEGGAEMLAALEEGEERVVPNGSLPGVRVIRNGEVAPPAFDLLSTAVTLGTLLERLVEAGAVPAGFGVWETLRIEHGRPRYGLELDRDTLLPEAGIQDRAVDQAKGCYTGQEVIVRIRDRGRVNRHLRGLLLGDVATPAPGTPIFIEGRDRPAGEIRSTAQSPRFGDAIALAYVRREAEPPTAARLGEPDGPEVRVRALSDEGWELVEGDPGR